MGRVRTSALVLLTAALTAITIGRGARALLNRQAEIARERIGKPLGESSLDADRVWRRSLDGPPVRLLLLGDSLAAGLGVERPKETLGGRLAKGLARALDRPVQLFTAAVVGSESSALDGQLDTVPGEFRADVGVIVVGGNDVTHLVSNDVAARHLGRAIRRLQEAGAAVVVGTCPGLGTLRPVPQPLRAFLSRRSRHLAAAQARVVTRAGAEAVNLRHAVGPIFKAEPTEMFSLDQFHPSASGYRRTAEALLPAIITALEEAVPGGRNRSPERNLPRPPRRNVPWPRSQRPRRSTAH